MTLPGTDDIERFVRALKIVSPSGSLVVERGSAAARVHDEVRTWMIREIPTTASELASITIVDVRPDTDAPGPGLGIALGSSGRIWRLDDEDQTKDLLAVLAAHGAGEPMATVLALYRTGQQAERALLDPPSLIDDLGMPDELLASVHPPRLEVESPSRWSLGFWSLASTMVDSARHHTLHQWSVQCEDGTVSWWSVPRWRASRA